MIDHTELYVDSKECLSVIPKISSTFDEPFADSSQIPTYLVAQLASKDVTVSLSGDAGDELFCGYTRYTLAQSLWSKINLLPYSLRIVLVKLIRVTPTTLLSICFFWIQFVIENVRRGRSAGDLIKKSTHLLSCKNDEILYRSVIQNWTQPHNLVTKNKTIYKTFSEENFLRSKSEGFANHMMSYDLLGYLPDDILVKVDRASMQHSLESRVPFLSKDIIHFSMGLPMGIKVKNGSKKWILKQVLKKYVPEKLFNRPKAGFGIPIGKWIKEDLNEWTLDLLNEDKINNQGYLNYGPIKEKLIQHMDNENDWGYHLWPILMFQQWLEDNKL